MVLQEKSTGRVCRDATRKSRALLEINMAKKVKANKEGFFVYVKKSPLKNRGKVVLVLNEVGKMVTENSEKADLLNAFFDSDFTSKTRYQESQKFEIRKQNWRKEVSPLVSEISGL